jgi:hypothetical protein
MLSKTFIFCKQCSFFFSVLKIIGHANPDNNLESQCISNLLFAPVTLYINCSLNIFVCYSTRFSHGHEELYLELFWYKYVGDLT